MEIAKLTLNNFISNVCYYGSREFLYRYGNKNTLVVCDSNTRPLIPEDAGINPLVLIPGEEHKGWESVELILKEALSRNLSRDALFVGIGGGVVTDMTAFAASIYLRGVDVHLVPTSLLAMSDAAVGGKTGMDFMNFKNMVGTFYPASEVALYPMFIKTLPEREYLCGLAEVIKSALLGDKQLLNVLEQDHEMVAQRHIDILPDLIKGSVGVKCNVVNSDFQENGIRAHLNLGHTFAHALESVLGFDKVSHGEAVAWGIVKAMQLGILQGITDHKYAQRVESLIKSFGFKLDYKADPAALYKAMKHDKKVAGGEIRFVLQRNLCDTLITGCPENAVLQILKA